MKWRDIIAAPKTIVDQGAWSSGRIPRGTFPLSRSGRRAYRVGNRRWRCTRWKALGHEFRVLLTYSDLLEQFSATLGCVDGGDMKVLCALEFHGTHPGWHLHVREEDIAAIDAGVMRIGMKRVSPPPPPPPFKRTEFVSDEVEAYNATVDFFRLDHTVAGNPLGL